MIGFMFLNALVLHDFHHLQLILLLQAQEIYTFGMHADIHLCFGPGDLLFNQLFATQASLRKSKGVAEGHSLDEKR